MLLHLGDTFFIRMEDILSIHDYEAMNEHKRNEPFWKNVEGRVTDISDGRKKTVVVTTKRVYITSISARTLKKRAEESQKSLIMTEV